ncbi:hypothetical protein [Trueperella bialowiezensis]|uniref:Uncharacterized protein n=1 Tax=Trueperella bialowiezensis TaxID=312285 RepID=A0A448PF55_9ACTO|nr:hypothetical protein [Trueperella bialowiezensis]VEI13563.1 Uncharacterised protein [Trueperella bialowiezensis]
MLSYFSPWPVHPEWYRDTVPPGHFTFAFPERDLVLWYDVHFSTAVLRIGQPNIDDAGGLQFRCYTNADGLTQFDATNKLVPFEEGSDIVVRYVLDTESWVAGPSLDYGSQISVLLADLMLKHRTDRPATIGPGAVRLQGLDGERFVAHVGLPGGVLRLLHVADDGAQPGGSGARLFQVVEAPLDGPHAHAGGALVVAENGVRMYVPDVSRGRFTPPLTGDAVPHVFHELAPILWAGMDPDTGGLAGGL